MDYIEKIYQLSFLKLKQSLCAMLNNVTVQNKGTVLFYGTKVVCFYISLFNRQMLPPFLT